MRTVAGEVVIEDNPVFSATAGLRNGDTVVAINGRMVDDPSQALTLWAELKDERSVEVAIVRRGRPTTFTASMPTW